MLLDGTNALSLFQTNGTTVGIFLNPAGVSSFAGSLVLSGTNNLMPNQTLTGSNSILTRGLADQRYMQLAPASLAVGGTNFVVSTNGRVGVGTSSPSFDISLDGQAHRMIGMERNNTGGGRNLTISAGSAGFTGNLAGGSLILAAGASTGSAGGEIWLQTPRPNSGSSPNPLVTRMRIDAAGSVGIGEGSLAGHNRPPPALDVSAAEATLVLGADVGLRTRTHGQPKRMQILAAPFYTNQSALEVMSAVVNSNSAALTLGIPSQGAGSSFTSLHFGTAPSSGAPVRRLSILSDGKVLFNETKVSTADFQVKGSVAENLLYVAAGLDRVGIGTNAPAATLHVAGGAQIDGTLILPNQTITNPASALTVGQADQRYLRLAAGAFAIGGTNLVVSTNGNVGIGTDSPGFPLDVNGYIRAQGFIGQAGDELHFTPGSMEWRSSSGDARMTVVNSVTQERVDVGVRPDSDGAFVQYGEGLSHLRIEQGTGDLGAVRAASFGVGEYGEEVAMLREDGSAFFTGSVGIGTNAPAAKVHVAGNARIDGALRIAPQGDLAMGAFTNRP